MDFNLDDPLGDILSDGSNDSFFETTTKKKNTTSKVIAKPKENISSKKMEDLFGIKETINKPETISSSNPNISNVTKKIIPDSPSFTMRSKPLETAAQPVISKADSLFNDDDIISDLGFDPKKPKSKSNLDDILGPIEIRKQPATPPARPLTGGGGGSKIFSRQSTDTTDNSAPGTYAASLQNRPKTAGRKQSNTSALDPLGLFSSTSTKDNTQPDINQTPKIKRKGGTGDWLGIDAESKTQKDPVIEMAARRNTSSPQILNQNPEYEQIIGFQPVQRPRTPHHVLPTNQGSLLFTTTNMETQNVLQTLQQQEGQVMIASQMRNQELALMDMQKKQQELLVQQETQFNELLQQQMNRQNQLEMTIRAQQERINAHIQLLMTQPAINLQVGESATETKSKVKRNHLNDEGEEMEIDPIKLENDVKRLEFEKLRLEELVSNIKANHEKELEFMENSQKKQINVLEENLTAVETRLQNEIKSIEEFYNKKLENLEKEKSILIQNFEIKIKQLQEEYENIIKSLKLTHEDELKCLKSEHKSMIETIRQSKLLEFSVVQENSSYLETLRSAANNLENATGDMQTLRDEISIKIDQEHREKEVNLSAREKKIEHNERRLKFMEESSEKDKSRLIELVTTLEMQLNKLSSDSADEQWNIRQKISSLDVERASFDREKLFAREQLNREEKRIEEMKQIQIEENLRLRQQIQDEKQFLLIEKAKLETSKKLEESNDLSQSKAELDTSLQVAKDVTKQADLERDKYFKKQRELEARKRELINQENEVRSKNDELEAAIISTKAKEKHIQEYIQRYRLAEQNFNGKTQIVQTQMRQLAERESQLSQERLILSRERLELQEFKRKIEFTKCSLCRIGEKSTEIANILTRNDIQLDYNQVSNNIGTQSLNYPINFNENLNSNAIDQLFDNDISESLKRMENLNKNFNNDLINIENNEIFDDIDLKQFETNSVLNMPTFNDKD